jgi:hypothetical protein
MLGIKKEAEIMIRQYCKLWVKFKSKPFNFKQAKETLKEQHDNKLSVTLSRLAEAKWISVKRMLKNKRIRQYRIIKGPEGIVKDIASN